ncbi:P-loop containing nucleoside triphosphate hydrolase [Sesbania bispinosa]|nr:P-loop containing nucleoside triphosphate hydrolase [Sesbania bispinosa]
MAKKVNDLCGIKESDTGLAAPSQWDLVSDKQMMQEEQPLQQGALRLNPNSEDAKYVINVKQIAKFVVGLGDKVSPTDIEEGMRVGDWQNTLARAVANRTDACFIRVIGSELVQKYVGEGARMVRELFQMARSKKACIVFFDEVDAIGGARFDDGVGGDNEVQRTMLEIVNQLDGFDARGNIKVLMATNRCSDLAMTPDTLDPALLRPGRLDRKVEFGLPDLERADIRSVCTEAGMYAIRARRKTVTEKDFLDAVNKVIKGYQKFSATPKYMVYN